MLEFSITTEIAVASTIYDFPKLLEFSITQKIDLASSTALSSKIAGIFDNSENWSA
ncbi:hypothetical protein [Moorena producens]|uniref:hypothetical protein n=1 Tax=Moorena producens TaxID=1155739 RepID=UPI001313DD4E|nr:hypothetical protein [Moorena producens]